LPPQPFLGAGVVTTQLGLRTVEPLSGAAISVPSFTLLFLLASPLLLAGEPVVWRGLPIFMVIGLFFPREPDVFDLRLQSRARAGHHLDARQSRAVVLGGAGGRRCCTSRCGRCNRGLVIAVPAPSSSPSPGRAISATGEAGRCCCRSAARCRGVMPPIVKLGLEVWPSPLWACLIGYVMSSLVVLAVQRIRRAASSRMRRIGPVVVRRHRHLQRPERADAVRRRAPRADHAGRAVVAVYPLVTVLLSAIMLRQCDHARIVAGTVLTVAGVALVLAG
jgi:hypothetical protein